MVRPSIYEFGEDTIPYITFSKESNLGFAFRRPNLVIEQLRWNNLFLEEKLEVPQCSGKLGEFPTAYVLPHGSVCLAFFEDLSCQLFIFHC